MLRKIRLWCVYVPERRVVLSFCKTKREAEQRVRAKRKGYALAVRLEGLYVHSGSKE